MKLSYVVAAVVAVGVSAWLLTGNLGQEILPGVLGPQAAERAPEQGGNVGGQ